MISIIWRKKIKFFLQKYFYSKNNKNIFDIPNHQRINKAVINLSVIPWNYRYQRPQQIAKSLAGKNIPVFYINNEFNITKNFIQPPFNLKTISQNLYLTKLSSSNNYFIYQNTPSKVDQKIISDSIRNLIKAFNISNPILKIDHPFWTSIASELKLPTIYDCLDNQDNFDLNSKKIKDEEINLFKLATKIVVTSKMLYEKASKYRSSKDIVQISNGTDYKHFTKEIEIKLENSLSKYPKPIYGYFGAIEKWLDTEFIENLAKNTKGTIILIGKNNLNYEPNSKNILLLGEKSYNTLPQYLTQFDVCLIPFKINSLTSAVDPVKIYEYFSQGKAVIASELPELQKYNKQLYFYSSDTDIKNLISEVLSEATIQKTLRQKIAQNNTWESKTDKIIQVSNHI